MNTHEKLGKKPTEEIFVRGNNKRERPPEIHTRRNKKKRKI